MAGVSDDGFDPKSLTEIIEEKEERAKELFGDDVDLSPDSALKNFIDTESYSQALLWQELEQVYYNQFFRSATGQSLDDVVALLGISREPATRATGSAVFYRSATGSSIKIPEGNEVGVSDTDISFETSEVVTVPSGSYEVSGSIRSTGFGSEYNVSPNTIDIIIDPVTGIDGVRNDDETIGGSDEETDQRLRERVLVEKASSNKATADAIRGNLLDEGAKSVRIVENTSDSIDGDGRPPHSFETYVSKGNLSNDDIAQRIWDTKPVGIDTYGTSSGTAFDDRGDEHVIEFTPPTKIDTYVEVDPINGIDSSIENNIVESVSEYFDSMISGEDIVFYKVVDKVFDNDLNDADVFIGPNDTPSGTGNIYIDDGEIANLIEVNVV